MSCPTVSTRSGNAIFRDDLFVDDDVALASGGMSSVASKGTPSDDLRAHHFEVAGHHDVRELTLVPVLRRVRQRRLRAPHTPPPG